MFYLVGLGNPGEEYSKTRHNIGRAVLLRVAKKHGLPQPVESAKYAGSISEGMLYKTEVTILLPDTYMNKSGSAVRKLVPDKEEAKRLVVIYDDVDLPVGEVKLSVGRGSGGHNGIESIIGALGTRDFMRIRVGIAGRGFFGRVKRPKGENLSKHVLGAFKRGEEKQLAEVDEKVDGALKLIIEKGIDAAMNRFN
jgi:PTH1 family peptidyl-tRNA hydrolase